VPTEITAALVGAGSIGGAAVYALARTPSLRGDLDIVDDDTLREHNPDRAILATEALAHAGAIKVMVARDALSHHEDLDVRPHRKRFEAFVAARPRELALPLVLSAVDSSQSRREIQEAVPLDVLDAACGVDQVSLSAHRTADGPCIYCLHVGAVLDSARIKYRLIAERTGLPAPVVAQLHVQDVPLSAQHIQAIEQFRREHGDPLATGALNGYIGKTLETLYRERFLYGEVLIGTAGGGQAAVAAPFVTALAGFLLAGEALKAAGSAFERYRLGTRGQIGSTMYREDPWSSALNALLTSPPRWEGLECLCRSPLRLRLLHERYTL
jgi:molybdopterin/thiamine biosynthesis adenylyltransferase